MDVARLSRRVHKRCEVPVTVSRDGEPDRTEQAVPHLDHETWDSQAGVGVLISTDAWSFWHDVDIARGDTITCSDPKVVTAETTWEITSRKPEGDDGLIRTWTAKRSQ